MNEEVVKQAKDRLQRIIYVSRNTAYDLVYSEIDIKCTEILLDYIEELIKLNKELASNQLFIKQEYDNLKQKIRELVNNCSPDYVVYKISELLEE